jgi:uncharacterized protein YkwD
LAVGLIGCLLIWQSSAAETNPRGDLNGDGKVNVQDLSILLSKYNTDSPEADLTGDGKVNVSDLSVLLSMYGSTATPGPAPTPAPVGPRPPAELASEEECPGQSNGDAPASQQENIMICMVNIARRHHGMQTVARSEILMRSAASKASDIEDCGFSHTACGRDFSYWFRQHNYRGTCTAENIARGQRTTRDVISTWLQSEPHRANMLNARHADVGVRRLNSPDVSIWVQHFGCK